MALTNSKKELLMQLGDSFAAVRRKIRSHYTDEHVCLTPALDQALLIVASEGTVNIKHIADYLCISPGAATQHIDALEKQGAVRRIVSDKDRRETMVEITPQGRKLYTQVRAKRLQLHEEMFKELDGDELKMLIKLLTKVGSTVHQEEQ